jgi:catechol 2,3-dioxygenase
METHTRQPDHAEGAAPFRLPAETRVGKVRLRVADLGRSLEFYRGVLGLHLARAGESTAALSAGDRGPELVELHERPGARPVPRRGATGLYHLALLVPDRPALGSVLERIRRTGWGPLGASDHAVSEALYTSDPDGNGIEIYRDRPRSTWRTEGGELHMTTTPLDLRALLAGAAPPAGGIAPGTTMGHVHLHVDDLERTGTFYRAGLGMDLRVWSYPGALFFAAGGYHHHLGTNIWAGPGAPRASEDDAGMTDWELVVPTRPDTEAVAASLRAQGFSPTAEPDGAWRVEDPSGIALRVVAEPSPAE